MSQMLFDQRGLPNAITIDYIKNIGTLGTISTQPTANANYQINLALGNIINVSLTANIALVLGQPINLPIPYGVGQTAAGLEWTLFITNNSGGALTTAPQASINASFWRSATNSVNPANGLAVTAQFIFDGSKHTQVGAWASAAF